MAFGDRAGDAVLIVRSVTRERSDQTRDLVEQGANLRPVINIVARQRRRDDPARVSIYANVELFPGPAPSRAMLLDQPLARPTQLQARAVHQQMHGVGPAITIGATARPWAGHVQRRGPAAQGGVVGSREIGTKQANDGPNQAFGLAVGQTEHGPER